MVGITPGGRAATTPHGSSPEDSTEVSERDRARQRVEKKHKFRGDLVTYIVINAFLIGVWALTGLGYFWPAWVLAGWGVLLVLDAWNIFYRRPITQHEIDEEIRRTR